jgi:Arc/MetJ family transcription regulator
MARTLLDVDDDALARAAGVLGTTSKVETVNRALRAVASSAVDASDPKIGRGRASGATGSAGR